jgi:hypothetical protein
MAKLRWPSAASKGAMVILTGALSLPGLAQTPADQANPSSQPPLVMVSQVKLTSGLRASKLVGAAILNDGNQQIGTVDDLILDDNAKAGFVVMQVGGFLGGGGKLVVTSYDKVRIEKNDAGSPTKVVMPGASKEELTKEPSFTYGG